MRELKSRTEVALGCVLLFAAYFVTALLVLRLDAVAGFATLVWPPTGIALAALLLFGWRRCSSSSSGGSPCDGAGGCAPRCCFWPAPWPLSACSSSARCLEVPSACRGIRTSFSRCWLGQHSASGITGR